jgi:predicted metal-dependent HD superfamily phosphohydrolase
MNHNSSKLDITELAKEYVNELLTPLENHYYHHYNHALEVMERSIYLWKKEWLSEEEIEIISLAALFHDTGFIIQYENNEYIWAKIAKNFLKNMLYSDEKIEKVEWLIMATDPKFKKPRSISEQIIKDADLDNIWRNDFMNTWAKLKKELENIKKIKILNPAWQHGTIKFLEKHKYYTKTQKEERWEQKKKNKKILENILQEQNTQTLA